MEAKLESVVRDLTSSKIAELGTTRAAVVDFWAPWCNPCRKLAPIFEEACKEVSLRKPGEFGFFKVNVEEEPSLAGTFGVMSIPHVIGFVGGKPRDTFTGRTKEDLVDWMMRLA